MKKLIPFIIACLCILILLCIFAGCSSGTANAETEDRMVLINRSVVSGVAVYVMADRETGVTYLAVYNGGMTVMLDENGEPLITDVKGG